ncbi:Golgi-associated RAB2 interactor protein 2 isoform X2 [Hemicordylus capensis]|uniref:Golgi-associated RAB2 interactor protein 2 isoform X2 n=1 Tax=Hemicordylus capensis TaxID=884348 RepID=UPI002302CF9D|nr:Golgi-associated RAB2 interactor protein 2 isoform X2 [Hemicordylus capensis]
MGELQRVLDRGEYVPLASAPVFESNFVQVNRRGESIYLHNRPNYVIMGVCSSRPNSLLPNVLLLAHSSTSSSQEDISIHPALSEQSYLEDELVLTRFLPLKFVDLSVHSAKKRRIKLKLVSGRAYYLELCAPPQSQAALFRQWTRLISLLKSKRSEINVLYKDFDIPAENRAIRNKTLNISNQTEPPSPLNQQASQESMKAPVIKQTSSKRVTISDIVVGPIEEFRKSRNQAQVSSCNSMRNPSADSGKQLKKSSSIKNRSREWESFSSTGKRLQTSGILKKVSKSEIVYYKSQ